MHPVFPGTVSANTQKKNNSLITDRFSTVICIILQSQNSNEGPPVLTVLCSQLAAIPTQNGFAQAVFQGKKKGKVHSLQWSSREMTAFLLGARK